jgi:tRNA(Ile)-lysidine synthase
MPVPLTLMQRFEKHVVSEKLITPGMKLVIAVSGGADSVALLHLLHLLKTDMHLSLLAVHVNHHLRGEESETDEQFVKKLCDRLNIQAIFKHVKLDSQADLENQARIKRRDVLLQILKSYKFDCIALAHQKNDQAETILMNLARGTGITGMGGIKPKTETILRPLLAFSRAEIEYWLKENKFDWREDKTNQDTRFTRNLIRKELVPWLEQNLNQSVTDRLLLQSQTFQQADDYFRKHTRRLLKKSVLEDTGEQITLDLVLLKQLAEIEQFYVLKACYTALSKTDHEFFMYSFAEIRRIFDSDGSRQTRLAHGIHVIKQYDELVFTVRDPALENFEIKELFIDEERTHFVFFSWRFTLKYLKNMPKNLTNTKQMQNVLIDMNKVVLPLKLRGRMPGDRFIPSGMTQEKKLKEFFIDEKVPKLERDKVPILTDSEKILWVVGYRLDNRALCCEETRRILHIAIEPVTTGRKRSASRAFNNTGERYDIYEL